MSCALSQFLFRNAQYNAEINYHIALAVGNRPIVRNKANANLQLFLHRPIYFIRNYRFRLHTRSAGSSERYGQRYVSENHKRGKLMYRLWNAIFM